MKMILSAIYIYPVKSLPGVSLLTAEAEDRGLRGDRRWMLTDEHGRFISLREERRLMYFRIIQQGAWWQISWENDSLSIPRVLESGASCRVSIWEDEVTALQGKPEWNAWFTAKLGRRCRLVCMPEEGRRPVKEKWRLAQEEVSFADGYPYLIVNESSTQALTARIGQEMDIRRFRPNLVLTGGKPFEEFIYREIQIGGVTFNGLKPCERCVVTTLDPDTGEQGVEPLKTLAGMKVEGKVVFGQHASLLHSGSLNVGDSASVLRRKDSPYDPL